MTPVELMMLAGTVAVAAASVCVANFRHFFEDGVNGSCWMTIHLASALVVSGAMTTLAGGFIWWLVDTYAK